MDEPIYVGLYELDSGEEISIKRYLTLWDFLDDA
jgi:hypothetical protein